MIVWLASYPRSGNTLLRAILKQCFGQVSQSIYSDEEFANSAVQEIVGQEAVGNDPHGFIAEAKRRNRTLFVKTHELPRDNVHRAIYIVRDGRSCVVSHYHFAKDILGRRLSLGEVIQGALGSSWSQHVNAWAFSGRRDTLVVRYEDLSRGCQRTLNTISAFIHRPLLKEFDIAFDHLHALYPQFFRRGSDLANFKDLDPDSMQLFERLHGDTLRRLGYSGNNFPRIPAGNPKAGPGMQV